MIKIIILVILIILILLFLLKNSEYFYSETTQTTQTIDVSEGSPLNKNVIVGNYIDDTFNKDNSNLYVGETLNQKYINYDTRFYFKINVVKNVDPILNESYYLNSGHKCPKQLDENECFKSPRQSKYIYETVLLKNNLNDDSYNIDEQSQSGLWSFENPDDKDVLIEDESNIYYGDTVLLKNIGSHASYVCICSINELSVSNYGNISDIYCYNKRSDAIDYGKWIIIPKYFDNYSDTKILKTNNILKDKDGNKIIDKTIPYKYTTPSKSIQSNNIYYDFYNNMESDYYDFKELKDKKIPINTSDEFLLINENKIDNNYAYLNICKGKTLGLNIKCNNKNLLKAVGSRNDNKILSNYNDNDFPIYNWSIKPINYDVNVYDTLYVDGSIKLGPKGEQLEITADMLRYIKSIPYNFEDNICLVDKDSNSETYNKKVCITKDKIEMLNGSRQINLKSIVPSKPFILYSGPNFTGRELRIGFSYQKLNELPYIGDINEWVNPTDNGKWLSLKIDGPYTAIIFSKKNFGYDDISGESDVKRDSTLDPSQLSEILNSAEEEDGEEATEEKKDESNDGVNIEINTYDDKIKDIVKTNPINKLVSGEGIKNVRELGNNWVDGIRSMILSHKSAGDNDYYELKCLEKYKLSNQPDIIKDTITHNNLFTANYCKAGNINQNFYFSGDNDSKFVESDIYDDLDDEHLHFHRHKYEDVHQDLDVN